MVETLFGNGIVNQADSVADPRRKERRRWPVERIG